MCSNLRFLFQVFSTLFKRFPEAVSFAHYNPRIVLPYFLITLGECTILPKLNHLVRFLEVFLISDCFVYIRNFSFHPNLRLIDGIKLVPNSAKESLKHCWVRLRGTPFLKRQENTANRHLLEAPESPFSLETSTIFNPIVLCIKLSSLSLLQNKQC